MRLAPLLALSLLAAPGCKKKIDPDKVAMLDLVRPALSMKVPDWKIVEDARDPGMGKYKVQTKNLEFVEVSWQGGEPLSAAELENLGRSVLAGFKLAVVDSSSSSKPGELRFTTVSKIGSGRKEVWMVMTMIQCEKTNVTVTVGAGTRDRAVTQALSDKVLADFHCIGDSPEKFAVDKSPPSSSLSEEFGYFDAEGTVVIVHPDGRTIFVLQAGGDNSAAISRHAKKTLDTLGGLLEMKITDVGKPRTRTGLGGIEMSVVGAKSGDEKVPLAASSYYCKNKRMSYTMIALTEKAEVAGDLAGLLTQFGCPGAGKAVTDRKSACDVGASAYCAGAE